MATREEVRQFSSGANQSGLRDYNERLLLSMIQRFGPSAGSDLARQAGLSAQTVSVILRSLESDGLLKRGPPKRGKVGKPSIPMMLDADGAYSIGMKVGRRSADLAIMDLHGVIRHQLQTHYRYPMPDKVFGFLERGTDQLVAALPREHAGRIGGIGIATPFEIWKWHETIGAPAKEFAAWKDIKFGEEVSRFSDLPVSVGNDATAACHAENVFGQGKQFDDYVYIFVGSFIGGGVVLDQSVYEGRFGNAGALGPLQSVGQGGRATQLLDTASLHLLETAIKDAGGDTSLLWANDSDWNQFSEQLRPWCELAGREIARAAMSACAVIDFEAVLIDGAFPEHVRKELVERTRFEVTKLDSRGLVIPKIEEGTVGANARVIGAAYRPLSRQHFLVSGSGLSGTVN